jgi:hypothetical protein
MGKVGYSAFSQHDVLGWDISRLSALADAFLSIDQSISIHCKNNPKQIHKQNRLKTKNL